MNVISLLRLLSTRSEGAKAEMVALAQALRASGPRLASTRTRTRTRAIAQHASSS
jgi:hypothetical protein